MPEMATDRAFARLSVRDHVFFRECALGAACALAPPLTGKSRFCWRQSEAPARFLLATVGHGLAFGRFASAPPSVDDLARLYGMHVAALARTSLDLDRIADDLVQNNVKTLSRYHLGRPTKAGLVFGYAVTDLPEIDRGLSLSRRALSRSRQR
jgi:hypothetical protein